MLGAWQLNTVVEGGKGVLQDQGRGEHYAADQMLNVTQATGVTGQNGKPRDCQQQPDAVCHAVGDFFPSRISLMMRFC